ncbi:hypothetical protein TNIN_386231 [Trichonephila inaurata madagascariensis]|uniref:Uncharacterized protein n=1 Tax=Trichonephila inaurata madagascariensis TaxID=2747483 RepID=A0A8X6IZ36_9ARAC|nr:hypothetical protein TNIN_386231 [Trichonephila inaurata madagascariensis]
MVWLNVFIVPPQASYSVSDKCMGRGIETIIGGNPIKDHLKPLSRTDKHPIKINDRTSTISIDRLKPAFLLNDTDSTKGALPSTEK